MTGLAGRVGRFGAALLALGVCAGARAADPYVGYIYPAGMQAGTTNRVVVGGQFFWKVKDGCVSGKGVRIVDVEVVPNFAPPPGDQRKYLVKWLDAIAQGKRETPPLPDVPHLNEWRSNAWWRVLGELDAQKLSIVEHYLHTPRNPLQMSPSLSQRLLVTVVADADAEPGVREFRMYGPGGMSAPRPFVVTSAPHIAEPLYTPPHRAKGVARPQVTELPAVLDGQIEPGSTDRWTLNLKKGRTVTLRTVAREFQPYVGDAVPGFFNAALRLTDTRGEEAAFADDWFYHPDPVLVFTPPADGAYTLEVHDVLYRGRADFVYQITVEEGARAPAPDAVALWPNPGIRRLADGVTCLTATGVIARAGAEAAHTFDIPAVGDWRVELFARRAGSPLDGRLRVERVGRAGAEEFRDVTNTLHRGSIIQAECDPAGVLHVPEPGAYRVTVADEAGTGGPEWAYTLRVHAPDPGFEVWASKSSFALRGGQRAPVKMHVVRHGGFAGDVRLESTPYFKFVPDVIPAASNSLTVAAVCTALREHPAMDVPVTASAVVEGVRRCEQVRPADEYNQAFAWDHLLPARAFWIKTWAPPPNKKRRQQPQSRRR